MVEPSQLKRIRVQVGMTQAQLANAAGVSQSLVAKIEADQVEPSFGTMKAISEALRLKMHSRGKKAGDVMSTPLISVQGTASLKECVGLMKRRGVSQLPVVSGTKVTGSVSESGIVALLSESREPMEVLSEPVSRHMQGAFPQVGTDTPVDALFSLFTFMPAVLVTDKSGAVGIVTKIDLLSSEAR
jgi:predicted transcriptional regulator